MNFFTFIKYINDSCTSKIEITSNFQSEIEVSFTTCLTIIYADGTKVTKNGETGMFKEIQTGRAVVGYGEATPI